MSEREAVAMTDSQHVYEVRPRKDHRAVDLISDALPFGRLWYGEPNAISAFLTRENRVAREQKSRNGKGVRLRDKRLSIPCQSFTVCSRPLAAQVCSLRAGRLLFGFGRPAL